MLAAQNHSDEAMLETDIMRFLAIMALCMMVIFSLVQSLPKTEKPEPSVPLETTDDMQVEQLKHQLQSLQQQMQQLQQDVESKNQQLHQLKQLKPFKQLVVDLNQQLQQSQQQSQKLEQQLKHLQKDKLVDKMQWQAQVNQLQHRLDKTEQKLQKNTRLLKTIASKPVKAEPVKAKPVKTEPKPKPVKAKPISQPAKKKPSKKGFSLRFASDTALGQLVQLGRVELWRKSGNSYQRWQVNRWVNASAKGQLYQMAAHTVPAQYRRQAVGNGQRQWYVALPNDVRNKISQLMKQQKGGELVIDASANVRLQ